MKSRVKLIIGLLLIFTVAVFINSCSENSISGPGNPTESSGIYVDDIQWVAAKPEFTEKMTALKKYSSDGNLITVADGGVVGGPSTFNNMVVFPSGAVDKDTWVTVSVKYSRRNFFYVEFLPSGSFNKFVDVTLSWAYLNIDESTVENLKVYFSQDGGKYWSPVESGLDINYDTKTVTFKIDHFTRFGWGI